MKRSNTFRFPISNNFSNQNSDSDDEDINKNVFIKYSKYLIEHLTEGNVLKYMELINSISPLEVSKCSSLLLYPITYHLITNCVKYKSAKSDLALRMVNCMELILTKSKLLSVDHLSYLNNILVLLIHSEESEMTVSDKIPEELKLGIINCKVALYRSLHQSCIANLYDNKNLKYRRMIATSIYFCLQVARNEKLLKLRLQALNCVLVISKLDDEFDSNNMNDDIKYHIGEALATMLPGVISACLFIIKAGSILNHLLYTKVVELFGKFTALVMKDAKIETACDVYNYCRTYVAKLSSPSSPINSSHKFRTNEWFNETREKLISYVSPMMSLRNSSHWLIRYQLACTIEILLTECFRNLGTLVTTPLIETAIILRNDEVSNVSKKANELIEKLLNGDNMQRKQIVDLLEENFHVLLGRIDSAVSLSDTLISELVLLNGYLNTIDLICALRSPSYLELLCGVLIRVFQLDSSSLSSFQIPTILELDKEEKSAVVPHKPSWLRMKYVSSDKTYNCISRTCDTIAKNADMMALSQHLFELFRVCPNDRKEIIFIMNNVLFNANSNFIKNDLNGARGIIQMYLDASVFDIPIALNHLETTDNRTSSDLSSSVIYNNILQVCLLVDGIGKMAVHMGQTFRPLLFNCLYPILERAASRNQFLSVAGNIALLNIIQSCAYDSLSHLIYSNVDYIIHFVIKNLKYIRDDQRLFDVLSIVIRTCSQQSLPALCDIMEQILRQSDRVLDDSCQEGFLTVFRFYVRKMRSWFVSVILDDRERINDSRDIYTSVIIEMDKYMRQIGRTTHCFQKSGYNDETTITVNDIITCDDLCDEEDGNNVNENALSEFAATNEDNPNDDDSAEQNIPKHIDVTVKICENVIHVLPSINVPVKVAVIEILMDSLLILAGYENKLLPIVHKIWSPLVTSVTKASNLHPLIVRQSFDLLCIMAVTARDFIKSRTLKDVFPSLTSYLQQTASESALKDKRSLYWTSQQYKLQLCLLQELGNLAVYIDLQEKEMHAILKTVLPYLSNKQPHPLQMACVELHKNIGHHHYGLVWTHLLSVWMPNSVIKAPEKLKTHFGFQDITIESCTDTASEYKVNVLCVLNLI